MIGCVLLNMGGPDSLDAVRPFLYNLFSDREIIRLGPHFLQRPLAWWIARRRAPKSKAAYARIGGASPLTAITKAQASAVQALLSERGSESVRCAAGMRYWTPRTPAVLEELAGQGVRRVLAFSLYPHYSQATSGSSLAEFFREAERLGLESGSIEAWPDHPGYIAALANAVRDGLGRLDRMDPKGTRSGGGELPAGSVLVYSAHSLPRRMVEEGDPYVDHLQRTIAALEHETGIHGELSFQSRSGPVAWLEPGTDILLRGLAAQGVRQVLVVPLSFVSDHVETLYEIDMLYGDMMARLGVRLVRTPSLNDRPDFVASLAHLADARLKEVGWRR